MTKPKKRKNENVVLWQKKNRIKRFYVVTEMPYDFDFSMLRLALIGNMVNVTEIQELP